VEYSYQAMRAKAGAVEVARHLKWAVVGMAAGIMILIQLTGDGIGLIGRWLAELSGFDSRHRYWRVVLEVGMVRILHRTMPVLTAAIAFLGSIGVLWRERLTGVFWEFYAPTLVVIFFMLCTFTVQILFFRWADVEIMARDSSLMRSSFFGRKAILWSSFDHVRSSICGALMLFCLHTLATTLPVGKLMWNRGPFLGSMRECVDSIKQMNVIFEAVNLRVNPTFKGSSEERWSRMQADAEALLSKPIVPERHRWFLTWAFWSIGLAFLLGVSTNIALRVRASKRLFPEQWKKPD
jgi:hypothetical protein